LEGDDGGDGGGDGASTAAQLSGAPAENCVDDAGGCIRTADQSPAVKEEAEDENESRIRGDAPEKGMSSAIMWSINGNRE